MGPWSGRISVLIKRDISELPHSSWPCVHPMGMSCKDLARSQEIYTPERELSPETDPAGLWFGTSSLQNDEEINFSCSSHPTSGILLGQPKWTNPLKVLAILTKAIILSWGKQFYLGSILFYAIWVMHFNKLFAHWILISCSAHIGMCAHFSWRIL